jgi:hypothetical protein
MSFYLGIWYTVRIVLADYKRHFLYWDRLPFISYIVVLPI